MNVHYSDTESFKVTLVDTGEKTMTAGRLKQVEKYIDGEDFMLTYGDGLADVNIKKLVHFHRSHNKIATLTAIQPEARFGGLEIKGDGMINTFKEKPKGDGQWINGGFFVLKNEATHNNKKKRKKTKQEEDEDEDRRGNIRSRRRRCIIIRRRMIIRKRAKCIITVRMEKSKKRKNQKHK